MTSRSREILETLEECCPDDAALLRAQVAALKATLATLSEEKARAATLAETEAHIAADLRADLATARNQLADLRATFETPSEEKAQEVERRLRAEEEADSLQRTARDQCARAQRAEARLAEHDAHREAIADKPMCGYGCPSPSYREAAVAAGWAGDWSDFHAHLQVTWMEHVRTCPNHPQRKVEADRDYWRTLAEVRSGEACAKERAAGSGGCGMCAWCCKQAREDRDNAIALKRAAYETLDGCREVVEKTIIPALELVTADLGMWLAWSEGGHLKTSGPLPGENPVPDEWRALQPEVCAALAAARKLLED
jgi:hypothetical protein